MSGRAYRRRLALEQAREKPPTNDTAESNIVDGEGSYADDQEEEEERDEVRATANLFQMLSMINEEANAAAEAEQDEEDDDEEGKIGSCAEEHGEEGDEKGNSDANRHLPPTTNPGKISTHAESPSGSRRRKNPRRRRRGKADSKNDSNAIAEPESETEQNDTDGQVPGPQAELNEQPPSDPGRRAVPDASHVWSVDLKSLREEVEIRRLFGSGASSFAVGRPTARSSARPGILAPVPREHWPPIQSHGLGMERVGMDGVDAEGNTWFLFTHSQAYQQVEMDLLNAQESLSPEPILDIVFRNPCHVGALVQLCYANMQTMDFNTANDYLGRALSVLERSWHPRFSLSTAPRSTASPSAQYPFPSSCRLSYFWYPNRIFFMALYLHAQLLARKGCWRTAMEVTKCTFRLDPKSDPMGCLLCMDFLAGRASEWRWITDVWFALGKQRSVYYGGANVEDAAAGEYRLRWYPNWLYTGALAQYWLEHGYEGKSRSQRVQGSAQYPTADCMLQEAIWSFPWLPVLLVEKCGETLPSTTLQQLTSIAFFQVPNPEGSSSLNAVHLLTSLYVERSYSLWKDQAVRNWLHGNLVHVLDACESSQASAADPLPQMVNSQAKWRSYFSQLPLSVYRHTYLADLGGSGASSNTSAAVLQKHIPAPFRSGPTSLTPWGTPHLNAIDSFPPTRLPTVSSLHPSLMPPASAEHWSSPSARSPIDPYDKFYRKKLVSLYPHTVIPFLLPPTPSPSQPSPSNAGNQGFMDHLSSLFGWGRGPSRDMSTGTDPSTHSSGSRAIRERLRQLGLDVNAFPADLQPIMMQAIAHSESASTLSLPSFISAFLQSAIPAWGAGSGRGASTYSGVDILDVPGVVEFLQGN